MHEPRPFFRKQTQSWYVQLGGKQVPLAKDEEAATRKYHELMAKRRAGQALTNDSVCKLLQHYLAFCEQNLSEATFTKNRFHLRRFANHIGVRLRVSALKPYHVQQWIDEGYKGRSDTYKNVAMTAVKGALKWAHALRSDTWNFA